MATGAADGVRDAHVVLATDRFDDDFEALTAQHGFRVDAIFPADAPTTAIVSAHGIRVRLESSDTPRPIALHLLPPFDSDRARLLVAVGIGAAVTLTLQAIYVIWIAATSRSLNLQSPPQIHG